MKATSNFTFAVSGWQHSISGALRDQICHVQSMLPTRKKNDSLYTESRLGECKRSCGSKGGCIVISPHRWKLVENYAAMTFVMPTPRLEGLRKHLCKSVKARDTAPLSLSLP